MRRSPLEITAWEITAWSLCAAGLAGSAAAWIMTPAAFPHAWLAALHAFIGWPLGCMGLLLIHALTGGNWGFAIRSQLVAGVCTLPLLPLALVPWVFLLPRLYPWLQHDVAARLENTFYLNLPAFALRGALYLVIWYALALLILRALRERPPELALTRLAPSGLILLALTVTFVAIDAIMSLDPFFPSSIFGLIEIAEMGLLALSVSILAATLGGPPRRETLAALARLLQALLILWAYLDFMQFLIVWQSDLPNEALWYRPRLRGAWGVVATLVAALHVALPFFVLLSPRLRQSRFGVASVAALLIVVAMLRSWWLVLPASGLGLSAAAGFSMLAVVSGAAALAMRAWCSPLISHGAWRGV